jgi:Nuclear fragile X mental retardation-interacting protein 1 (NUFIP1)
MHGATVIITAAVTATTVPDRSAALLQQVAQWRAERRRCWPSKQNVERKEETGGVCLYTVCTVCVMYAVTSNA